MIDPLEGQSHSCGPEGIQRVTIQDMTMSHYTEAGVDGGGTTRTLGRIAALVSDEYLNSSQLQALLLVYTESNTTNPKTEN